MLTPTSGTPQASATNSATRRLARESSDFRDLVLDFTDAQQALGRWEQTGMPRDESRVVEYRELVSDLSNEIRRLVARASPHKP